MRAGGGTLDCFVICSLRPADYDIPPHHPGFSLPNRLTQTFAEKVSLAEADAAVVGGDPGVRVRRSPSSSMPRVTAASSRRFWKTPPLKATSQMPVRTAIRRTCSTTAAATVAWKRAATNPAAAPRSRSSRNASSAGEKSIRGSPPAGPARTRTALRAGRRPPPRAALPPPPRSCCGRTARRVPLRPRRAARRPS